MDSIIFDVDGTLWDSTEIVAETWNQIIREQTDLNIVLTADSLMPHFGKLLPEIAACIFPGETKERQMDLIERCCALENAVLWERPGRLYPDLAATLAALSRTYRLFIVSNCQAGYIEAFLHSTGLGELFEGHLCPGDTGCAKAENIRRVIGNYRLSGSVYVGDTRGDQLASQRAGIPFVFASYGFGQAEEPDYVIDRFSQLTELF